MRRVRRHERKRGDDDQNNRGGEPYQTGLAGGTGNLWAAWRLEGDALVEGQRKAVLEFVDPERIITCTNYGMAPLARDDAGGIRGR